MIKKIITFVSCFFVASCSTFDKPDVFNKIKIAQNINDVTYCKKITNVTGQTPAGRDRDVDYEQALNSLLENSSKNQEVDTVLITRKERVTVGGKLYANAYNCKNTNLQINSNVINQQQNQIKPNPSQNLNELIRKAKKCQLKKGLWINDRCLIITN